MSNLADIFVQGNVPVMLNVCIPVLLVSLFIAVSSYKVFMLTYLSHI